MYLPPEENASPPPPRLLLASPSPHPPQMNVFKAAGWKALSILSVLIIRFLTAPLIVDHMACLQLEYILLLLLLLLRLHSWFAWLADFPPYAALCWMTCISWWMGETFGLRGSVWKQVEAANVESSCRLNWCAITHHWRTRRSRF